jgi:hypothetical protein
MPIDVELVCTDTDLIGIVLGEQNLQTLLPEEWLAADQTRKTARPARDQGLTIVLSALALRGITEASITNPAQLKIPVAYATLEMLYRAGATTADSANMKRADVFLKRLEAAIEDFVPKADDDEDPGGEVTAGPLSVWIERA